jgi:stage V sporulation protein AC
VATRSQSGEKAARRPLSLSSREYRALAGMRKPPLAMPRRVLRAFVSGGTVCLVGQGLQQAFTAWLGIPPRQAGHPALAVLILLAVALTSCGLYGKLTRWAGAGLMVPVTGFANAMCAAALEHRAEGLVLGVGARMFRLAGPVVVFGVAAAFAVGVVHGVIGMVR